MMEKKAKKARYLILCCYDYYLKRLIIIAEQGERVANRVQHPEADEIFNTECEIHFSYSYCGPVPHVFSYDIYPYYFYYDEYSYFIKI